MSLNPVPALNEKKGNDKRNQQSRMVSSTPCLSAVRHSNPYQTEETAENGV